MRLDHPVLGVLVGDPDGAPGRWLKFCRFPAFQEFAYSQRVRPEQAAAPVPEVATKWESDPEALVHEHCRFDILYPLALKLGVFPVAFRRDAATGGVPAHQVAAWSDFALEQQTICEKALDAMLRYALQLHMRDDYLFEMIEQEHSPAPETGSTEWLKACVEFGGVSFGAPAGTSSSVILNWDPVWDGEHGCRMVVHGGEVIFIGSRDDVRELEKRPRDFAGKREGWETDQEYAELCRYLQIARSRSPLP